MKIVLGVALLAFALLPAMAEAADRTIPVAFARGASSTAIKGSIKGYGSINYTLRAAAGQTMTVSLTTGNSSAYFNVMAPGADETLFNGSISGNRFSGKLLISGVYTVQVYLMRNAARRDEMARFSLNIVFRK